MSIQGSSTMGATSTGFIEHDRCICNLCPYCGKPRDSYFHHNIYSEHRPVTIYRTQPGVTSIRTQ